MKYLPIALALPLFVACSDEHSSNLATSEIGMNAEVQLASDNGRRSAVANVSLFEGKESKPTDSGAVIGYVRAVELSDGDELFLTQGSGSQQLKTRLYQTEINGETAYTGTLNNVRQDIPVYVELRRTEGKDAFDNFIPLPSSFQLVENYYRGDLTTPIPLAWQNPSADAVRAFALLDCRYTLNGESYRDFIPWESGSMVNSGFTQISVPGLDKYLDCVGEAGIVAETNGQTDSALYSTSSIKGKISQSKQVLLTRP